MIEDEVCPKCGSSKVYYDIQEGYMVFVCEDCGYVEYV